MTINVEDEILMDFPYFTKRNVIVGFILICLIFTVIIILGSSRGHQTNRADDQPVLIDQSLSTKRIYSIIQQPTQHEPHRVPISPVTPVATLSIMRQHEQSQKNLQSAGISPISVYEGIHRNHTNHHKSDYSGHDEHQYMQTTPKSSSKAQFLQSSRQNQQNIINHTIEKPLNHFEIKAGTIIPAALLTGINSDLPGTIIAKVRRSVFDTVTGSYLLIPQGATLLGVYDAQVTHGQQRVLVAWQRLIFPNGNSVQLDGQSGVDLEGFAGLKDQVNRHTWQLFGSAMMYSLFSAASQLSQPSTGGNNLSAQQVMFSSTGQQISQTGAKLASRNLSIQPTLEIRPGMHFNVILSKDLLLPSSYSFDSDNG